jgi:hypothetical protein
METLDAIDQLARRARMENPPIVDVNVHALLRACGRQRAPTLALAWPAAVAALAACVVLAVMHFKAPASSDSVAQLFGPVQVQMP